MKIIYKEVGETPLECLNKYRLNNNIPENERLSYVGRLDPMAEGELMIISGDENDYREKYLSYDKSYDASFLLGVETDTGDILGLITDSLEILNFENKDEIKETIINFKNITEQTYPWFSSKTVNGKSLFDWYKSGNSHLIQRPKRDVKIHSIHNISFSEIDVIELEKIILERISKVNGDFRQQETVVGWQEFFKKASKKFYVVNFEIKVSTGTYIRALTEEIKKNNQIPALLLNLKRSKIHI